MKSSINEDSEYRRWLEYFISRTEQIRREILNREYLRRLFSKVVGSKPIVRHLWYVVPLLCRKSFMSMKLCKNFRRR